MCPMIHSLAYLATQCLENSPILSTHFILVVAPFSLVSNQLSVDSQAASKDQAANSSEKVISPNALLSTSTPSMVSSSTSSINKLMTQSLSNEIADDTINNPFDITENKEYDRTHDFETSQLNMINVLFIRSISFL